MLVRSVLCLGLLSVFAVGCDDSGAKKPFPTTSQSPAIPMPPSMKAPQPDTPAAGDAKPDKN